MQRRLISKLSDNRKTITLDDDAGEARLKSLLEAKETRLCFSCFRSMKAYLMLGACQDNVA